MLVYAIQFLENKPVRVAHAFMCRYVQDYIRRTLTTTVSTTTETSAYTLSNGTPVSAKVVAPHQSKCEDGKCTCAAFVVFVRPSLRYVRVFAIANPSVVCDVRTPYLGVETFGNIFAILCLSHLLTSMQNFTEIVPREPLRSSTENVKLKTFIED